MNDATNDDSTPLGFPPLTLPAPRVYGLLGGPHAASAPPLSQPTALDRMFEEAIPRIAERWVKERRAARAAARNLGGRDADPLREPAYAEIRRLRAEGWSNRKIHHWLRTEWSPLLERRVPPHPSTSRRWVKTA